MNHPHEAYSPDSRFASRATIAVTGIGVVSCHGVGIEACWSGIRNGIDRLAPWRKDLPAALRSIQVAQCPQLPCPVDLPPRFWNNLSRTQQLACIAGDEALASAGLPRTLSSFGNRAGCFLATTVCGMDRSEDFYAGYRVDAARADSNLMRRLQPYEALAFLQKRHRIGGPCYMNLTTCVGSAMALGAAMDALRLGRISIALAGGTESLCRLIISGFNSLKLVAMDGCRPFDAQRRGISVGEGSAILVLETAEHAAQRDAKPLGFIRGFAATCDAFHITKPDPEATAAIRAMELALANAGMAAGDIQYINAHGTGTRDNDAMEARAISEVYRRAGAAVPPVGSTKRLTGHTFGAAGALEAAICLLAMDRSVLPPNAGCRDPEHKADGSALLPLVLAPTPQKFTSALSCNFAFGGNNTAIVFSRANVDGEAPRYIAAKTDSVTAKWPWLTVAGMGVMSCKFADAASLAHGVAAQCEKTENRTSPDLFRPPVDGHATTFDRCPWLGRGLAERIALAIEKLDPVAGYACAAIDQAWRAAGLDTMRVDRSRVALVLLSAWGMIESTKSYLDSMLDDDGRFASPLHFSRSVYSNAASAAAILFDIHGPCETLSNPYTPLSVVISRAGDLLMTDRVDVVVACWADQTGPLAEDFCRRAVRDLGRKEFSRYLVTPGYGAVSLVLKKPRQYLEPDATEQESVFSPQISVVNSDRGSPALPRIALSHPPFPTDASMHLAAAVVERAMVSPYGRPPAQPAAAESSPPLVFKYGNDQKSKEFIAIR